MAPWLTSAPWTYYAMRTTRPQAISHPSAEAKSVRCGSKSGARARTRRSGRAMSRTSCGATLQHRTRPGGGISKRRASLACLETTKGKITRAR